VIPASSDAALRRVIGDGETVPDGTVDGLNDDGLLALHRDLVLLRTYDERSVVFHRQGRIGTYAIFYGHEAMQAGAVRALDEGDWIFPSYRESAIGLLRGMPASTVLAWWRGHPNGWWDPRDYGVASICVPIATHVPHAAGFAWGMRLRGEDRVSLALFGDGATSEGAFHEGANFAAVMGAPTILLCNNNGWAISTPLHDQTRAATLADKAAGYGMPGVRVDGGRAGAGGGGADIHRGHHLPHGPARHGGRPERLHRRRPRRGGARARVPVALRGLPAPTRPPRRRPGRRDPRTGHDRHA
jgi:pyruvate dehydrogenase E1 component alpha subunit